MWDCFCAAAKDVLGVDCYVEHESCGFHIGGRTWGRRSGFVCTFQQRKRASRVDFDAGFLRFRTEFEAALPLYGCLGSERWVIAQIGLFCFGDALKWVTCIVYFHDCKNRIMKMGVDEEVGKRVGDVDGKLNKQSS